jgi:hypothetical protein
MWTVHVDRFCPHLRLRTPRCGQKTVHVDTGLSTPITPAQGGKCGQIYVDNRKSRTSVSRGPAGWQPANK